MHCRPFAAIQHAKLNSGGVDRAAHLAAQSVDLPYDLPFGDAARSPDLQLICPTVSQFIVSSAVRAPSRAAASAASTPGVPAADDDDVKIVG